MIKPKTIEIEDLAKRWRCQPKQIIEAAIDGQIKLYFSLGYGVIADLPNPNPGHRLQLRPYQGGLQVDQPTLNTLLHTNEARDVKEAYTPEGALVYVELPPHGLSPRLGGRTMQMTIQMAQPLDIKTDDLHACMDDVEACESTGRVSSAPEPVVNSASDRPGSRKMWTPERLAELAAYRARYTMAETAAKFGISEQRIRQLLPSAKPKASPFPGVIHRLK